MRIITTLLASAVAALSFSAAQAADAVMDVPAAPAADYAAPAANWAGAYAGANLTYQKGENDVTGNANSDGLGGSAFAGYNLQNGQLVYGVEGDIGYSGVDSARGRYTAEQGVNGSVRGRVGVDLNPVLVYGTGGVAIGNTKVLDQTSSDKQTGIGWTAGAGVEGFVTDRITARAEYRYTDYGRETYNLDSGKVSSGYDDHSVRVGMGVKF